MIQLSKISGPSVSVSNPIRFHGMIGVSPNIRKVFAQIRNAGASALSILVSGEPGTGKDLVARAIHEESLIKNGPFVPIHCGALPKTILERELFGGVSGKCRLSLALGGTLFLDEVAELPLDVQSRLVYILRELKERTSRSEKARIVSATHRDLRSMVACGAFRADLFSLLSDLSIVLPPLRERCDDIVSIARAEAAEYCTAAGRAPLCFDMNVLSLLQHHRWPGNIHQLKSVIRYAAMHCATDTLREEHLPRSAIRNSFAETSVAVKRRHHGCGAACCCPR